MKFTLLNKEFVENLKSEPFIDYGKGLFSPNLRYLGGSIYLFGAPSGFGKTFFACAEACKFANQGYRTAYVHTEMTDKQVVLNRFTHCPEFESVLEKETLAICGTDELCNLENDDDSTLTYCDVIIIDYVNNMAISEDNKEGSSHINLSNYMKKLDDYRKKNPTKLILVYAQLVIRKDKDGYTYEYEDCHNLYRSVDVSLKLVSTGSTHEFKVDCNKCREGENQYRFANKGPVKYDYTLVPLVSVICQK